MRSDGDAGHRRCTQRSRAISTCRRGAERDAAADAARVSRSHRCERAAGAVGARAARFQVARNRNGDATVPAGYARGRGAAAGGAVARGNATLRRRQRPSSTPSRRSPRCAAGSPRSTRSTRTQNATPTTAAPHRTTSRRSTTAPVPHRLYLGHAELFKLTGTAESCSLSASVHPVCRSAHVRCCSIGNI